MGRIDVRPDELDRMAVSLSGTAEDMQATSGRVDHVKQCVEEGWQSNYTAAYIEGLDVLKRNLQLLAESTRELSDMVRQTAADIRRVEEENRVQLGGGGR